MFVYMEMYVCRFSPRCQTWMFLTSNFTSHKRKRTQKALIFLARVHTIKWPRFRDDKVLVSRHYNYRGPGPIFILESEAKEKWCPQLSTDENKKWGRQSSFCFSLQSNLLSWTMLLPRVIIVLNLAAFSLY